jgi:hypothetical protein
LKKEGSRRGGNGNITEQVNLFNVYGTEVWSYHNEIPFFINVCQFINKIAKKDSQKKCDFPVCQESRSI